MSLLKNSVFENFFFNIFAYNTMNLIKPNINKFMSEKKDLNKSIPDSNDLVNEIILLKNSLDFSF